MKPVWLGAASFAISVALATSPAAVASSEIAQPSSQQQTAGYTGNEPYWDAALPVEQRVADLLARMTLEEKVGQMVTIWNDKPEIHNEDNFFDPAKASARFPDGLGFFARPHDLKGPGSPRINTPRSIEETVRYMNAVQKWARESTRLGIPVLAHEEALHGLAAKDATSFPQAIGLASTWDMGLIHDINAYIATEVRARGVHQVLSPVVDVVRDPRWGRIEETFGEDPFLVAEIGVASVNGLQGRFVEGRIGDDKVLATLKHMTGHGQPESGTNIGPAQISERTLRENFFPPFEEVVERTDIRAVMASYNEIDGIPSHSSSWLLQDILRGEWGFKGAVVSDYYAIEEMVTNHSIAADVPEAARIALLAGVDVDLPSGISFSTLTDQVRSGEISEAAINTAVERILALKFRSGLFEQPYVTDLSAALASNGAEGRALAFKAAEKSLILLKNDGTLPLDMPLKGGPKPTIAAIGPNADVARLGGYYGIPRDTVSPLRGLRELLGDKASVTYAQGVVITENDDWWADEVVLGDPAENRARIAEAVQVARDADTIVLFIGDTEQTSREGWAKGHLGDRASLDLVGQQMELFDALKALSKPLVVVLINGRPPSYPRLVEQADAILETWYAGEQQGHAIANALFGDVNPGGKLPVTVARSVGQLPLFYNHKPSALRGYLFEETTPLFPFGFGLSYTSFQIGSPALSATTIDVGDDFSVKVQVTNTGKATGDEVVQIYVRDDVSSVTRPVKQLAGFARVTLAPGETRTVEIDIAAKNLSLWDRDMRRVIEPGTFTIMAGSNSQDLKSTNLTVRD